MAGENLGSLIALWADAVWSRRADAGTAILDADVVWEDPVADVHGRDEVLALLQGWDRPPRLTRLEAVEHDDQVLLCSRGPDLHAGGRMGPEGESYLVFTFSAGQVTRIRSFRTREEALAAV